jgi:hypothetical protein
VVAVPHHRPRRGRADDRHRHARAPHDGERREGALPVGSAGVRGEEWEARLRPHAGDEPEAVVELVVSHRRGIVGHRVHRGRHRVRGGRVLARGHVGERRALQHVAGIDEHHAIRVRGAQRVDHGGGRGERVAGVGPGGEVVPPAQVPVHVGGRGEHDVDRVARGRARRGGGARMAGRRGGSRDHGSGRDRGNARAGREGRGGLHGSNVAAASAGLHLAGRDLAAPYRVRGPSPARAARAGLTSPLRTDPHRSAPTSSTRLARGELTAAVAAAKLRRMPHPPSRPPRAGGPVPVRDRDARPAPAACTGHATSGGLRRARAGRT